MKGDQVRQQKEEGEGQEDVTSRQGVPQGKKKQGLTRFGQYIETLAAIFEVTHEQIARGAGLGPSTISKIIHNAVDIPERTTIIALWQSLRDLAEERGLRDLMTSFLEEGFYNSAWHVTDHEYDDSDVILQALKGRVKLVREIQSQGRAVRQRDLMIEELREEIKDLRAENIQLRKQLRP
jgi:hypothetical protein